jgi:Tfp pilus assembly protein PilN
MRAVNLLPRQQVEQRTEAPNTVALVAGIGAAIVVLGLVGGFLLANRSADRERQALATAKAVLAVTPANKTSAKTQAFRATLLSQREERTLALASAIGKRVAWDRIFRHIALVLPGDIWLTQVKGSVPLQPAASAVPVGTTPTTTPSALPPTPTALEIDGYTYSQAAVARFLERLQVVPDLKNVQLKTSAKTQIGTQTVVSFTIISDIRKGRGAS